MKFKDLALIKKYLLSILVCSILFLGVILIVNNRLNQVEGKISELEQEDIKVNKIKVLVTELNDIKIIVADSILEKTVDYVDDYNLKSDDIIAITKELINEETNEDIILKLNQVIDSIETMRLVLTDEVVYAVKRNNTVEIVLSKGNYYKLSNATVSTLDEVTDIYMDNKSQANKSLYSILDTTKLVVTIIIIISIFIVLLIIFLLTQRISKNLNELLILNKKIANKDLTTTITNAKNKNVKSKDEIGLLTESTNQLKETLRSIVSELINSSKELKNQGEVINSTSNVAKNDSMQINVTMTELSTAISDQANLLNDIVLNIDNLNTQIIDTNTLSRELTQATDKLHNISNEGNEIMVVTVESIGIIDTIVKKSVMMINKLEEHTNGISLLTDVINNISSQIDLLALNASIEAARAGEAGRGFSVVAGEMGQLSKQVSLSVIDIEQIIQDLQTETKGVSVALVNSYEEVEKGTIQVKIAGEKFEEVNKEAYTIGKKAITIDENLDIVEENSNQAKESLERISAISQETAASIEETLISIREQNTQLEELSNNSDKINSMSDVLSDLIGEFDL